jgi:Sec-independent protein secretion pathway component TatC
MVRPSVLRRFFDDFISFVLQFFIRFGLAFGLSIPMHGISLTGLIDQSFGKNFLYAAFILVIFGAI